MGFNEFCDALVKRSPYPAKSLGLLSHLIHPRPSSPNCLLCMMMKMTRCKAYGLNFHLMTLDMTRQRDTCSSSTSQRPCDLRFLFGIVGHYAQYMVWQNVLFICKMPYILSVVLSERHLLVLLFARIHCNGVQCSDMNTPQLFHPRPLPDSMVGTRKHGHNWDKR